jgi:Cytidylyltransferase-like
VSDRLLVAPDGSRIADAPHPRFLLPGSFDPLHDGHRGMFDAAMRRLGPGGAFELSVTNVEKPPLGDDEIQRRLMAFAGYQPLWLTRAPTFVEKAHLFPGAVFVVGADTAARIVQPRFYEESAERMRSALEEIRAAGCRFLVAGRVDGGGRFIDRDALSLHEELADLFEAIAEGEFRLDLSSTMLRSS